MANQLIQTGHITRPYLGISFQPITPDIANAYGLPVQYGAYITNVSSGSPASKAGLRQGDIITSVGNIAINEKNSYINVLFNFKPGDQVTIDFIRNNSKMQAQVTLGTSPN